MSSGSGSNLGDITANSAKSTNKVAHKTSTYNGSKVNEFNDTIFKGPTTFGTSLCFVFRWDIACG